MSESCEVDTQSLPRTQAAEVENLVETSGILSAKIPYWRKFFINRLIVACDLLSYSISIESSKGTYKVAFDDSTIPEGSRPLLNYLKNHVRLAPRG